MARPSTTTTPRISSSSLKRHQTMNGSQRSAKKAGLFFSHDRKFHTLFPEISAIKQYKAGCFYLSGAGLQTWDKTYMFIRAYEGIRDRIAVTKKPTYLKSRMRYGLVRFRFPPTERSGQEPTICKEANESGSFSGHSCIDVCICRRQQSRGAAGSSTTPQTFGMP
jgi:hypothetical protein